VEIGTGKNVTKIRLYLKYEIKTKGGAKYQRTGGTFSIIPIRVDYDDSFPDRNTRVVYDQYSSKNERGRMYLRFALFCNPAIDE
jgi:hypothetical protein